jgi:hypothetical protein
MEELLLPLLYIAAAPAAAVATLVVTAVVL